MRNAIDAFYRGNPFAMAPILVNRENIPVKVTDQYGNSTDSPHQILEYVIRNVRNEQPASFFMLPSTFVLNYSRDQVTVKFGFKDNTDIINEVVINSGMTPII